MASSSNASKTSQEKPNLLNITNSAFNTSTVAIQPISLGGGTTGPTIEKPPVDSPPNYKWASDDDLERYLAATGNWDMAEAAANSKFTWVYDGDGLHTTDGINGP